MNTTPAPLSALSDEQLSEAFALEVAGWTKPQPYLRIRTHDRISIVKAKCPTTGRVRRVPSYATLADAVLPYLAHFKNWEAQFYHFPPITVRIRDYDSRGRWFTIAKGKDRTFPRAACCALIMAARARKHPDQVAGWTPLGA